MYVPFLSGSISVVEGTSGVEDELVVEEKFPVGFGMLGSQASIETELDFSSLDPSPVAVRAGHAKLGNMDVLEGCGSPFTTPFELDNGVAVFPLGAALGMAFVSCDRMDIINGFANADARSEGLADVADKVVDEDVVSEDSVEEGVVEMLVVEEDEVGEGVVEDVLFFKLLETRADWFQV